VSDIISHLTHNLASYIIKNNLNLRTSECKVTVIFCTIVTKVCVYRQIFSKNSKYDVSRKFHADRRADRRDEANSRFTRPFVNVTKIGVTDFEKCRG